MSEGIEIVRKTCWWLKNSDNFFISSTCDQIKGLILSFQQAYSIDIVAVNLCA